MNNSKIVITGATGWLGSELSKILVEEHNLSTRKLHCISTTNRKVKIGKNTFTTITFRDLDKIEDIVNYYDFAFLPRHNIDSIGPNKYKEANELIDIFDEKYNQGACPLWVGMLIAKIYKAKSMLVFLETPLED